MHVYEQKTLVSWQSRVISIVQSVRSFNLRYHKVDFKKQLSVSHLEQLLLSRESGILNLTSRHAATPTLKQAEKNQGAIL